jgi:H+/Cl- antiporter ClcA
MQDEKENDGGSVPSVEKPTSDNPVQQKPPKIWHIIGVALIAIAFTAVFMISYSKLENAIWFNDFVKNNTWMIPVGVLFFSLLVGLAQKYLHAPNAIHGGVTELMKGGSESNYKTFPGALLTAFASLLSGASVGPEGCVGVLVGDIAAWIRNRLKIPKEYALQFDVAALASAFNGIVGSAVFTGIFATEYEVGAGKSKLEYLIWNLLAGVIGFMFYALLGLPSFASLTPYPPIQELSVAYAVIAIILGLVGALVATFSGLSMQVFGKFMEKTFKNRIITRSLVAGAVIAAVSFFIPELMFSGEAQIHAIINNAAQYSVAMLLLLGILKILLLALSFKSGFLGGPIFPILFSCTMIALALGQLFPSVPLSLLVVCIEASAFALALGAPFTAILLISVVNTSTPSSIALIVLATVIGLIVGFGLKRLKMQGSKKKGAEQANYEQQR